VALEAAHARAPVVGQERHRIAHAQRAADQRAGDDRPEAANLEAAVHLGVAAGPARRARVGGGRELGERGAQRVEPAPGRRRHAHDRRARERVRASSADHLLLGELRHVLGGRVDLGERHDRARDAEQLADRDVLARLRHHALVGRHHEQQQVDARGARDHRAHEPLVAGHVDHAEPRAVGQVERREAELDRDAARLLLGQPVGVDAGQRSDERGLAVIDVAGGPRMSGLTGSNAIEARVRAQGLGIAIEPSACWWFSSSAISARAIATAVPFSVCTSSFFLLPLRRKRVFRRRAWKSVQFEVLGHLAPVAALAAPGIQASMSNLR
jgi:hypothetical protein